MKERPILFSTPMVQAVDDDRKTVTRRVVNMLKEGITEATWGYTAFTPDGHISFRARHANGEYGESFVKIPYGLKGDILYVREVYYDYGLWEENGHTKTGKRKWKFVSLIPSSADIRYCENPPEDVKPNSYRKLGWYKRLGRFMPYRYVRTKLEIVSIRVERLHDITEEDAIREGLAKITKDGGRNWKYGIPDKDGLPGTDDIGWPWIEWEISARDAFKKLWVKINGDDSWKDNPWVWRIEFTVLPQPPQI